MIAEALGHQFSIAVFCDFDASVFEGDFGMPEERRPDVVCGRWFG
jgi:hypothetical protein